MNSSRESRESVNILDLSTKNSIFREIAILIYLAQRRASEIEIEVTTTQLANYFSISQQTASRCLQDLDKKKIVNWKSTPKGSLVKLTPTGISILEQLRFELEKALHPDLSFITLKGKIVTGTGQGKYYISRPSYLKSFKTKLGFTPYHGTLNVRIDTADKNRLDLIRGSWPTIITGFEGEEREFGDVLCYPLEVIRLDAKAAGIKPRRTHHGENILEIISDVCIRDKMNLEDGDEIIIKFSLEQNEHG